MIDIKLAHLIDAGVHFGHKSNIWNPKMFPYIYEEKDGIHIIDLVQTVKLLQKACQFVNHSAKIGKIFLFVGTKQQAAPLIEKAAKNCNSYYINYRWLGGTLTNWATIKLQIEKLKKLEHDLKNGLILTLSKVEALKINKELKSLQKYFSGIRDIPKRPDIIVIVDQKVELIATKEAKYLNIPIISILDTNCDPDLINFPIPGNDDSITSIDFILKILSKNILEGLLHK